jgi:hypothetical protein
MIIHVTVFTELVKGFDACMKLMSFISCSRKSVFWTLLSQINPIYPLSVLSFHLHDILPLCLCPSLFPYVILLCHTHMHFVHLRLSPRSHGVLTRDDIVLTATLYSSFQVPDGIPTRCSLPFDNYPSHQFIKRKVFCLWHHRGSKSGCMGWLHMMLQIGANRNNYFNQCTALYINKCNMAPYCCSVAGHSVYTIHLNSYPAVSSLIVRVLGT